MVSDRLSPSWRYKCRVLILVLMEYGLWLITRMVAATVDEVLILVLMEYGLWLLWQLFITWHRIRLNPCSNGIWSLTGFFWVFRPAFWGLNPCSNGIWSLTALGALIGIGCRVLILVLMEYGLWHIITGVKNLPWLRLNPCSNGIWSLTVSWQCKHHWCQSLNPCSNGIWSLTQNH